MDTRESARIVATEVQKMNLTRKWPCKIWSHVHHSLWMNLFHWFMTVSIQASWRNLQIIHLLGRTMRQTKEKRSHVAPTMIQLLILFWLFIHLESTVSFLQWRWVHYSFDESWLSWVQLLFLASSLSFRPDFIYVFSASFNYQRRCIHYSPTG